MSVLSPSLPPSSMSSTSTPSPGPIGGAANARSWSSIGPSETAPAARPAPPPTSWRNLRRDMPPGADAGTESRGSATPSNTPAIIGYLLSGSGELEVGGQHHHGGEPEGRVVPPRPG